MPNSNHYVWTVLSVLTASPDRVVLWWRDQPITGAEFSRAIMTAARGLRREGVGEGSVVTLLIATSPEMLIARYAVNLLGATALHPQSPNAVNPLDELSIDMQVDMVAESRTTLVIVDAQNVARGREIVTRMVIPPTLAALGVIAGEGSDLLDLSSGPQTESLDVNAVEPTGIAVVVSTSGSSGRPKGVPRTFASLRWVAASGQAAGRNHTMLISTPLHGPTGASWTDAVLMSEGTVVLHQGFDPAAALAAISKYRITRLCLTPPQLYKLVEYLTRATTDISSVQQIIYSGCIASPRRIAQALEVFGPILTQVYGMAETTAISMLGSADHKNPKLLMTVGRPVVEMAIRDPRTQEDLPAGQTGEVCVRSLAMMEGYWHDPEATAKRLRDGWLRTGDVGYLDSEGYLHLVDRLDRMIKTQGIKVYPATVEDVLLAHPTVGQAAVFKVVDADEIEHIYAAVVPRHGATVDPAELRVYIERELSAAYVPVEISVLDALPLMESGKPDTRRLSFEVERAAGWRRSVIVA